MFTYNLIKVIAWVSFAAGAITAIYGISGTDYRTGVYIAVYGLVGGLVTGGLFLFFAKLLEQNDELHDQNEKLLKALTDIDANTRRGRYNG
jgi:hypothetical protein